MNNSKTKSEATKPSCPPVDSGITDEMIERLAIQLLNEHRMVGQVPPTDSLDDFSDFAKKDWRDRARKLLRVAFGEEL